MGPWSRRLEMLGMAKGKDSSDSPGKGSGGPTSPSRAELEKSDTSRSTHGQGYTHEEVHLSRLLSSKCHLTVALPQT